MTSSLVQIKQLAHRLESTSSAERIEALGELQSLARSDPATVGEAALLKAFKILREHSNPEEYAEALDLTSRLISCSDKAAARGNSSIILSDARNVELLLELLEHEDMTVGVMTSQILTELHVADGNLLEVRIQDCPDGKELHHPASLGFKLSTREQKLETHEVRKCCNPHLLFAPKLLR